jgi:transposase
MAAGKPSYDELAELLREQAAEIARLKARIAELEEQLRAALRPTAPFRRRESQKKPVEEHKRPGRAEGHEGCYRLRPSAVDQEIDVPLTGCPHCQGELDDVRRCEQIVEELPPVQPVRVKLTTWTGLCPRCGPVRSTHPLQTSTAVGAAGTHLGPRAQAVAILLAHQSGLSMRRACRTLDQLCGLRLSPGGLAQLLQRAAGRLEAWWAEIAQNIRDSRAVFADETSWYVGRPGWWLWVFTTPETTLYRVEDSRGSDVVHETLGSSFEGTLVSDCLASYNRIDCRKHKCIAHHLRVLSEHETALHKRGRSSSYLLMWKLHLKDVIATWKNRPNLSEVDYARKVLQLTRGVNQLLERSPPEPEEAAFRNRLRRQQDHLLGCLREPAAEPTNNRAERDLRPAVIDRKLSCGNKTHAGKHAWEVLRSVVTTIAKRRLDTIDALTPRLRLATQ